MFKLKSFRIVYILSALVLLGGCAQKYNPSPIDTVLGSSASKNRSDFVDTIKPTDSMDLHQEGLSLRDGGTLDKDFKGDFNKLTTISTIYFKFDAASIEANERSKLQTLSELLKSNINQKIIVIGHCDVYGTPDYNLSLGWRRAESVSKYLETLGVSKSRIETLSRGSLDATMEGSKELTASDRRCDIKYTN